MNVTQSVTPADAGPAARPERDATLRRVAQDLEAAFLAEMLKGAGVGEPRESFGGGIGEEQFGSFLREAVAKDMVEAGGLGLSEALFRSLARMEAQDG